MSPNQRSPGTKGKGGRKATITAAATGRASQVTRPVIRRFASAKQRRMDELLGKNGRGETCPAEKRELRKLVAEAEALMVENARGLADFAARAGQQPPAGAMPVTVWVKPEPAGR